MHVGNGHKIFFFCMFANNCNQIIELSGLSQKDLTLPIHNIFLQIYGNGLSHTEILHRFGNGNTQLLTQVKEMIDRRTSRENNSRMIFCCLNSLDERGSTLMNGRKSISTPYFSAMSKYGDFSDAGFGCDTSNFLMFNAIEYLSR